jgi:hypothetical protein
VANWTSSDRNDFAHRIRAIDWSPFWTAYGHAHKQSSYGSIPDLLIQLSSEEDQPALRASDTLWASLCHQEIRSSPAALPAMPFLLEAFDRGSTGLRFELLELFKGFAVTSERNKDDPWSSAIIKLLRDVRERFQPLSDSAEDDTRHFADEILRITT